MLLRLSPSLRRLSKRLLKKLLRKPLPKTKKRNEHCLSFI